MQQPILDYVPLMPLKAQKGPEQSMPKHLLQGAQHALAFVRDHAPKAFHAAHHRSSLC